VVIRDRGAGWCLRMVKILRWSLRLVAFEDVPDGVVAPAGEEGEVAGEEWGAVGEAGDHCCSQAETIKRIDTSMY
jgi:hypothetical protein